MQKFLSAEQAELETTRSLFSLKLLGIIYQVLVLVGRQLLTAFRNYLGSVLLYCILIKLYSQPLFIAAKDWLYRVENRSSLGIRILTFMDYSSETSAVIPQTDLMEL